MARILVVDDSPDLLRLTSRLMMRFGHQADAAASGAEALRRIRKSNYDVILLDIAMPEMDGLEVLRRVPDVCPDFPPPAVVMLTAQGDAETREEAKRLGASDFLVKGQFDPGMLKELVSELAH